MAPQLHAYLIGILLSVFVGICVADIPQEPGSQEEDVIINLDNSWSNKTCKNIFCCIDGVLSSLNTTNACLRVEGYGCHLRYQLQKFADIECKLKAPDYTTLMCRRNILNCAYDLGSVLLDTQDKDCSDSDETLKPMLHCSRKGDGSLECEFKNNTSDLSECPDVANCNYKKERVSCPSGWAPHRGHCYIYKEHPRTWQSAEDRCNELGDDSYLTSLKRREENDFTSYDLQKASRSDTDKKVWWIGLRKIQPNQQHTQGHVFQWSDNTTLDPEVDYKNWGIPSPETDVNNCVYVRDGQWYLANCDSEEYAYTCKMPATVDEDVPVDNSDPLHPYKSLSCRHPSSTTIAPVYSTITPIYTTENKIKQTTPVMTTTRYTTQEITTKLMTTDKLTTKMMTTDKITTKLMTTDTITTEMMTTAPESTTKLMTTQESTTQMMTTTQTVTTTAKIVTSPKKTTLDSRTPDKLIEREASTKQVGEELNNVTKGLNIPEETIEEINAEMDTLTTNVVSDTKEASSAAVEAIDNVMDLLAGSISQETLAKRNSSEPIVIESESMVVQVFAIKKPKCVNGSKSCSPAPAITGGVKDHTYSVDLPEALLESGATLAMSTVDGLQETMPTNTIDEADSNSGVTTTIGSLVTSIAISRWDNESVTFTKEDPLVLTFSVLGTSDENAVRLCSYWQPNALAWSSEGCQYNADKSDASQTTCECTHLTSFAVLMQVMDVEAKPLPKSLDYLTYIGCGLSIFCLLLLIFIFIIQKMHRSDRNIIHMNLALALLIAQIIFVIGIDQTSNQGLCKGIAACLQYFLLSTFFWMLNEAIFLLSKTTSAKFRWLKMPLFLAIGWGSPVLVVGITLAAAFKSAYHTENYCWLQAPKGIWAFVGPAALIIIVNTGILIKVIHTFLSLKANMNKKKKERIRLSLRAMLLTLPLLGSTWLIGIFSMDNKGTLVFAYMFVILNSLQGVFIFVLYCVMNDEVKKGLEKRMSIFSTRSSFASSPGQSSNSKGNSRESGSNSKPGNR